MKLNKLALSITLSVISGMLTLLFSVWHVLDGFAADFIRVFVSCHPTVFTAREPLGFILVNTGYGLIDGFILGYLFAVLYNYLVSRFDRTGTPDQEAPGEAE